MGAKEGQGRNERETEGKGSWADAHGGYIADIDGVWCSSLGPGVGTIAQGIKDALVGGQGVCRGGSEMR